MKRIGLSLVCMLVASLSCRNYVTVDDQAKLSGSAPSPDSSASTAKAPEKLSVTGGSSGLERITKDPVDEFAPAISRDGKSLLFQVETYEDSERKQLKQQTLVGVDPSTGGQRTFYTSASRFSFAPTYMPDGTSYAYVSNATGPFSVVRALTSAPNAAVAVVIGSDAAPNPSHPTVSPDGTRIAFGMTNADGSNTIGTVGVDGSRFTVLGEGREPSWSPDGKQLAFVRNVNGFDHIFLIDPEKGVRLVELTNGSFDATSPCWSPDSQFVAFASNRGFEEAKRTRGQVLHLYAVRRDGTQLIQLTQGESMAGAPAWSTDGWIYFSSDQAGNYDIWRIKPEGQLAELATPASPDEATNADKPDFPIATGCAKDGDCKGSRVCEYGQCVEPKP